MNNWYQTKIRYTKEFTDGTLKRTTEPYLINAMSFTEAEARIHKEVGEYVRGEFAVTSVSLFKVQDIFEYDDSDVYFKAKVSYLTEDADTGKEKKFSGNYLVSAKSVKEAYERIQECLKGLMVSYQIEAIAVTKIVEIFEYEAMESEDE